MHPISYLNGETRSEAAMIVKKTVLKIVSTPDALSLKNLDILTKKAETILELIQTICKFIESRTGSMGLN